MRGSYLDMPIADVFFVKGLEKESEQNPIFSL